MASPQRGLDAGRTVIIMGDSFDPIDGVSHAPSSYVESSQHSDHQQSYAESSAPEEIVRRHWRSTLNRWLLILNPGRTQTEYEKAVGYFFETIGVPQDLDTITFDLLLAYRGSLAMRADRRRRSMPRKRALAALRLGAQHGAQQGPLWTASATHGAGTAPHGRRGARPQPASERQGPLSPATVNVRLTALRQFLLFAHEQQTIPDLTPDRIRSALRRLHNERRRPYQILAEDEWADFLRAALGPTPNPSAAPSSSPHATETTETTAEPSQPRRQGGPWGMTRAEREQERKLREAQPLAEPETETQDGRTGLRTAQRDHALISLALATGLRAIELSLLDVGDLVSERRRKRTEWWLVLPDEKTKGQRGGRSLPLAPNLVAILHAYIRSTDRSWEHAEHRGTPLFLALARGRQPVSAQAVSQDVMRFDDEPRRRYRRLRPEQIRSVIHRVERLWKAQRREDDEDNDGSGVTGDARHISPHALRHSAAIALLLGNEANERPPASVEHVRGWLGHFDIRTTQRYLDHIESRDQRRAFAIRPPNPTHASSHEGDVAPVVSQQDADEPPSE